MKRLISGFLVLIMVLSLVPFSAFGTIASAMASTSEREAVLSEKGELRRSGNWVYSVVKYGIASIEGYEGDASSLRIPAELDGYPVGLIADNAFASQTRLSSVTIPTQVFSVGENAFANPSALTVTGYDGSAGLEWAQANGAGVKSLTDMYLNEDIIDLSGVGNAAQKSGGNTLLVDNALSFALEEGKVFFFTATDKYGLNYWGGRVTSVSRGENGSVVSYQTVEKDVLIDKIIASSDMEEIKYEFAPAPGLFGDEGSVDAAFKLELGDLTDIYAKASEDKTLWLIKEKTIKIFGVNTKLSSKLDLDFSVLYDARWGKDRVTADFDVKLTTTINAEEKVSWHKTMRLGEVTIYGVKGFRMYVPIDLVLSADGSVKIEIVDVVDFDWNYDSDVNKSVPKPVLIHSTPTRNIIFTGNASMGLKFGIAIEALDKDLVYLGAEGGVKAFAQLTLPRNCLDLELRGYAKLKIEVILIGSKTFTIADEVLFKNHYELDSLYPLRYHEATSCTRGDKTVKFNLNGGEQMNAFSDKKVAWNSSFFITAPTRAKYDFVGWYLDAALTQPWIPGSNVTTDITLHAKWERKYEPAQSISISQKTLEVYTSGTTRTKKLTATVLPADATNRAVKWTSSNRGIASVDANGNVSGVAPGTATITATSADNKKFVASCTVTVKQYVNAINVSIANPTIIKGNGTRVSATVLPAYASNRAFTWSSSNPNVASVDANGQITGVNPGTASIIATAGDGSGTKGSVQITVLPIPVSSVTLNMNSGTVYTSGSQQTLQLSATVLPVNAGDRSLYWHSSNPGVAVVDASGRVTGKSAGTCVITAQSVSTPAVTAQFTCVVRQYVNSVTLSPLTASLEPAQTVQLSAAIQPADASDKTLKWISNRPSVATVDQQGLVTAVAGGTAVISAVSQDGARVVGQCRVSVSGDPAPAAQPDPAVSVSAVTLDFDVLKVFTSGVSQQMQLTAAVEPANAGNPAVVWSSSDPAVVTVNSDGVVTGGKAGTAVVTAVSAENSAIRASCTVTVEQLIDSITLNHEQASIYKGESISLSAVILPASQAYKPLSWSSSDPAIARVDHQGHVSAVGVGSAVITVSAQDGSTAKDTFAITVLPVPVSSVTLKEASAVLYTTGRQHTVQLVATVAPSTAEDQTLTWISSNPDVASVDQNGVVTGVEAGTAVITARSNSNPDKLSQCTVTVKKWVAAIEMQAERKVMAPEETLQIQAVVSPADATNPAVVWNSSNPNVVSVSGNGLLSAHAPGKVTVQAASVDGSGVVGEIEITVMENPVYAIELSDESIEIYTSGDNSRYRLSCELLPANATYRSVTWYSSDNEIAYVDAVGNVVGVSPGKVVIGVQADSNPDVFAECEVTVRQRLEALHLLTDKADLLEGETLRLTAECAPSTASDKALVWSSSNQDVAAVSDQGVVTAKAPGAAVITVAAQNNPVLSSSVEIRVEEWISISGDAPNHVFYANGNAQTVLADVLMSRETVRRLYAAGLEPEWTLTGGGQYSKVELVVKPLSYWLDTEVEFTGATLLLSELLSAGMDTYTLTCRAGAYSASKSFQVVCVDEGLAEKVSVGFSDVTVGLNQAVIIPAIPVVDGEGNLPQSLTLTLSGDDLEKAAVAERENGIAVSFDESSIYVITANYQANNMQYSMDVTIRVCGEDGLIRLPVKDVQMAVETAALVPGDTLELKAFGLYGSEQLDCSFVWTSSNEQVASVDQNGRITAISKGVAVIEATAPGGASGSCSVTVEDALSFAMNEVRETVWVGGSENVEIANVVITSASASRIADMDAMPEWKLEKISGDSVELAVQELDFSMDAQVAPVVGSLITLVRIYGAGQSEYVLTCTAGGHTASVPVIVNAVQPENPLPEAVALAAAEYEAVVGEKVTVRTAYTLSPAGSALPEDAGMQLLLKGAMKNAVSEPVCLDGAVELVFNKSGVFTGWLEVYGTNYSYEVPFTVTVADENGVVAKRADEIIVEPEYRFMLVGESVKLAATVLPADAVDQTIVWKSYDETVATVSEDGTVTATGAGRTIIHAVSPDTEVFGESVIYVENGLTMDRSSETINVYLDGLTRTSLNTIYLSYASSQRVEGETPSWTLRRVRGSCLSLSAVPVEEMTAGGMLRYGAEIKLQSVTRAGTAEYDLICSVGGENAVTRITVNALSRTGTLPDHVLFEETDYYAAEDELIIIEPELVSVPAEVPVPADLRLSVRLDDNGAAVVNENDYFVSRARSTISFGRAGTYFATFVYSCGNVNYTVPVVFHISDQEGNVPVFVNTMTCEPGELFMEAGDSAAVRPVFYPVNATEQRVTYSSTNTAVATVSADGVVTAVANGYAQIVLTPYDEHVAAAVCNVTVEEGFHIIGATTARDLYLQGTQEQNLTSFMLTEGTLRRLEADGLQPVWNVNRKSGNAATFGVLEDEDHQQITLVTEDLRQGGTDVYTVSCTAGANTWSQDFTLNVIDLGVDAPKTVKAAQEHVTMAVGETKTLTIEPLCEPAGTVLPEELEGTSMYTGVGNFYDALDFNVYDEDENQITVAFTRPGTYLLLRTWSDLNLEYNAMCVIEVTGETEESESPILWLSDTECTVYAGGKSSVAVTAKINDWFAYEAMDDQLTWELNRVSGSAVTASLVSDGMETGLYVANVKQAGTDVWRLTCRMGCYTESVDITVNAVVPRAPVPDSIMLVEDTFRSVAGEWIHLPFAVTALPAGSRLPDTGSDFWKLEVQDEEARQLAEVSLTETAMRVRFSEIGSYTGALVYESGNICYRVPVYFYITDEEGMTPDPQLKLTGSLLTEKVWMDGLTDIGVVTLKLTDSDNGVASGAGAALVKQHGADWKISITSGAGCGQLSIEETTPGQACVVLDALTGVGTLAFEASCTVRGKTYTYSNALTVVDQSTPKPVLNMGRNLYTLIVGETAVIDRRILNAETGMQLASASGENWNNSLAIEAMGYGYETEENTWVATFYEKGVFHTTVDITVGNLVYSLPLNFTVLDQNETEQKFTLHMPRGLVEIQDEAMLGIKANVIDLRGSNVEKIGSKAFGSNNHLELAYLPSSVREMADDAFEGSGYVIIICPQGSFAEEWASDNGYAVQHEQQ